MQRHPSMRRSGRPNNGRLDKREGPTMTNLKDNAAAPSRTTVRIPTTSGDELEAWLYLPEGNGPHPAVVMADGIGAIKAGGLAPFAERFCRDGFAAVVFDYRQWGGSSGEPREELSFSRQLEDYGTVIGWASDLATSLSTDSAWAEWQQLPPDAQHAESELRNAIAKRVERAAASHELEDAGAN